MTTVTITIEDASTGELTLEGRIEGHAAGGDLPAPSPALVVASYISAHAQQISEAALVWFKRDLPKADVEGAPV